MRSFVTSFAFLTLALTACTGVETDSEPEPTKSEARAASKADGFDYCEAYGWYGDGVCDDFCAQPDPDCETGCYNDDDCTGGDVCDLSTCAPCPEGMVCPAVCRGVCAPAAAPVQHCGGLLGLACDEGEYCSYAPDAICGFADATGVCEPRPDACIQLVDPVCGCDGNTYSNACVAAQNGVSVSAEGACAPAPAPSCEGQCGLSAPGDACFCDDQCSFYGDCCADYEAVCG